ncbi:MAG: hypothetical protein ACFFB5_06205 [Promethearchaeota archaeon]
MVSERWGTLSVRDHLNPEQLAIDLLLYDRLVFPYPGEPMYHDQTAFEEWEARRWHPIKLKEICTELGTLAILRPWDKERRERYKKRLQVLKGINLDAKEIVDESKRSNLAEEEYYDITRQILALEQPILPKNVSYVNVVAAYRSRRKCILDFQNKENEITKKPRLSFLIGQKIAIPEFSSPRKAIDEVLSLVRKDDFRRKRRELYEWQEKMISKDIPVESAVIEMNELVQQYNDIIKNAKKVRKYKLAFTLIKSGISAAAAAFVPIAVGLAFVDIAHFLFFDRKLQFDPGENKPAAMIHDIQTKLGWSWKGI